MLMEERESSKVFNSKQTKKKIIGNPEMLKAGEIIFPQEGQSKIKLSNLKTYIQVTSSTLRRL